MSAMPTAPVPIGDYGLLGDTRTALLVSGSGSIDWMCAPAFDSPPVFGRLVGGPAAGSFRVGPARTGSLVSRRYRGDSATLETVWAADGGRLTLTEAMVAEVSGRLLPTSLLVRRVAAEGQPVEVEVQYDPRPARPRELRWSRRNGDLVCESGPLALSLQCEPTLQLEPRTPVRAVVVPGRPLTLVLGIAYGEPLVYVDPAAAWELVAADEARWEAWAAEIAPDLPFRPAVVRSLLTLRLLTYSPSGAPVAAPTTSLPENPGGVRNWDYRFTWPRDASIGVATFLGVGKTREAGSFLSWLLHASRLARPRLPALLTLMGRTVPRERELAWPGYAGSTPVRLGNLAAEQHQLDGYGWVLDAAWVFEEGGHRLYSETWRAMRAFADLVAARWREPDAGIWEVRGAPAHHVHSKLMGWLALDRALRLAERHRVARGRRRRWEQARAALAAEVRERGVDAVTGSYARAYGADDVDAALLMLPVLGFEDPASPRVRATIDRIRSELSAGDGLVYRYPPGRDGLPGTEGAFLPCSFWLVQALALTGRRDEAVALFSSLLGRSTPLGLYAEEMDPETGEQLGNFPQALTHAALVQAALALRDTAGSGPGSGGV